ncbi:unnamed protein product [Microthlaspi erraticum]|uniref:Uncharacterized protein n=1 Tax=Microthlaspi erraticum TaxID=1685480 RepID=A0A6D2KSE5_9BRAS|nr:unnamed protein product [Microthlaspi erraticum]CAA7054996.1 unnamed protein product [Microthlaspi erraticum]
MEPYSIRKSSGFSLTGREREKNERDSIFDFAEILGSRLRFDELASISPIPLKSRCDFEELEALTPPRRLNLRRLAADAASSTHHDRCRLSRPALALRPVKTKLDSGSPDHHHHRRNHHANYLIRPDDEGSATEERCGKAGAAKWRVHPLPPSTYLGPREIHYGVYFTP